MKIVKKNYFFRVTPTSAWVPFRAKFWPLGQLFHPSSPLAYSLILETVSGRFQCRQIKDLYLLS